MLPPSWPRETPHLPVVPRAASKTQRQLSRRLAGVDDRPGARELDQVLRRHVAQSEPVFVERPHENADERLASFVVGPSLRYRALEKRVASLASGLPGHAEQRTKKERRAHPSLRANAVARHSLNWPSALLTRNLEIDTIRRMASWAEFRELEPRL